MKILAERLRLLRKEKGWRQEDVANMLNLSTNGYQRYELNTREPEAPLLVEISKLYQVSTDYLLGRTNERS